MSIHRSRLVVGSALPAPEFSALSLYSRYSLKMVEKMTAGV
jgi:hypothetical protein